MTSSSDLLDALYNIAMNEIQSFVDAQNLGKSIREERTLRKRLLSMDAMKVMRLLWRISTRDGLTGGEPFLSKTDIVTHLVGGNKSLRELERKRVAIFRIVEAMEIFGLVNVDKATANRKAVRSTPSLDRLMAQTHKKLASRARELLSGTPDEPPLKRFLRSFSLGR